MAGYRRFEPIQDEEAGSPSAGTERGGGGMGWTTEGGWSLLSPAAGRGKREWRVARDRIGVDAALTDLPGWSAAPDRDALVRTYRFGDFGTAWAFMTRVALLAEKLDHHPEWTNVHGRVEVLLTTHDAGGVTALDVKMARFMDACAAPAGRGPVT